MHRITSQSVLSPLGIEPASSPPRRRRSWLAIATILCLLFGTRAARATRQSEAAPDTEPGMHAHVIASRCYIGLGVRDLTAGEAVRLHLRGVFITNIDHDGPAWVAGLRVGDLILAANKQPVVSVADLARIKNSLAPGDTLRLRAMHAEMPKEVTLILADEDRIGSLAMQQHIRSLLSLDPSQPSKNLPYERVELAGIAAEPLTPQLAVYFGARDHQGGLLVSAVQEHSAASDAGLLAGDVLLQLNGHPIGTRDNFEGKLLEAVSTSTPSPVQLTVLRDRSQFVATLFAPVKKKP